MVGATVVSHASFDLMLFGENPVGGMARVTRYDPISRRALGSFGESFIPGSVSSIAVDPATGTAFVASNAGAVTKFNYNTGEYLGAFGMNTFFGGFAYDTRSNLLMGGYGNGSGVSPGRGFNVNTGASIWTFTSGFTSTPPLLRPGTSTYFTWGLNGSPLATVANTYASGGGSATNTSASAYVWTSSEAMRASAFVGDQFYGVMTDGAQNRLYRVGTTTTGFSGPPGQVMAFGGAASPNLGIVNGHADLLYLKSGNQLNLYSTATGMTLGTQTLPFGTASSVQGMAIVLAPEPGTMIALGLGLAALVRRRRSRR